MMKSLKSLVPALLTIAVVAVLLLVLEGDFLWKVQEQNLFLATPLFFKEQLVVPGGFLSWLGAFFTQFLYHPWVGVLLIAVWWLLLAWLVGRAFRLNGWLSLLSVVPVVLILVTIVDMGYWVYMLKLRGHFFVTTIGATTVTALVWAFRVLSDKIKLLTILFPFFTCVIGYPLLGIYALAASLLMAVWIWRLEPRKGMAVTVCAVGLLSIVVVPLLCYRYMYYQTNLLNIYYAELPLYYIQEDYQEYYVPYYLLLAFFVGLALTPIPTVKERHIESQMQKSTGKKGKTPAVPFFQREGFRKGLVGIGLLTAAVIYAVCYWYRDENFQRELAMQHCMEQLDWQGMLREAAAQQDEPTRAIVVMRNIALARLGRQGNEMYHYLNGSKRINAPFDMRMLLVTGPQTYYQYGMVNSCYRLSMEMCVEFGWRVEYIKYLALCSVLNGEWQAARKYTHLFHRTLYFHDWASRLDALIAKPDEIAKDPEMGFITHMMHYDSRLASDHGYVEESVMKNLTASTFASDPIFVEQAMLASLYTKDVRRFWRHLSDYVKLHPNQPLPIHVQEAALLFGTLEDRHGLDTWPISESVRQSYNRFLEVTPRYNNMEADVVRKALGPLFGRTYFYEYYVMIDLQQY
ncbi:MAG: hypothetical protein J6Z14_04560 [Prevotella sp.]|nr:hypothetical protein [Prevotella sp.]